MKPYLLYANHEGDDIIRNGRPLHRMALDHCDATRSDKAEISRREFVRRAGLFIPAIVLGGALLKPQEARAGSTIITRTISSAQENAVSMSNSTWARSITLPGSWNHIRVGIRCHYNGTGATLSGLCTLALGFCSGTTNQYGDATTTHFVGAVMENTNLAYGTCGVNAYVYTPPMNGRVRIGTTNTSSASLDGAGCGDYYIGAGAGTNTADRTIVFFDLTKGSPNYTFHCPFTSATCCSTPVAEVSASRFLLYMGQTNPTPTESSYGGSPTDRTLAVDEGSNGTLNAVNLAWNRSDAPIEVTDVAVSVLS